MLTLDESIQVADRLVAVATLQPSPRQFLVTGLYEDLRGDLGEGAPRALVDKALVLCTRDAYRNSPAAMVHLLSTLMGTEAAINAIVERIRTPPPQTADPFDAIILNSKLPFLERGPTRAALKSLLDRRPQQPVVVVNGARRAGKTYTAEFVDHVLNANATVQHCRIEINEMQGASVGPVELAADMVALLGGDPSKAPGQNTNLDRWAQEIANWVISVANQSGGSWWFILDGFNSRELRPDTQLLITKLSKSLTTGLPRDRYRLILIDFDRSLLPLQPGLIADQTTGPIPQSAVEAVVEHVVARSPIGVDMAAISAKVLEGFPDPVTDLPELGSRLGDLIASMDSFV